MQPPTKQIVTLTLIRALVTLPNEIEIEAKILYCVRISNDPSICNSSPGIRRYLEEVYFYGDQ